MAEVPQTPEQQHPQKGETEKTCQARAEQEGALSYDEFGTACWAVYGKEIPINSDEASIMEGFMITNFNFRAGQSQKPVSKQKDLPGPSQGVGSLRV